jgi:hypothetical protein
MAWLSITTHASGDTPVLATVLNNIGADIRTRGGAVDGGGYDCTNNGNVALASGKKLGVGITAAYPLHVSGQEGALAAATNVYALAVFSDGGGASNSGIAFNTGATGATAWRGFMVEKNGQLFGITRYDSTGAGGYVGDFWIRSNGIVSIANVPAYANNAAAITGGLVAGDLYCVTSSNPRQVAVVY